MTSAPPTATRPGFKAFYRGPFLDEHRDPVNRGLHVFGTLLGLAFVPVALVAGLPWLVLLFPIVHAAPGLIGHRLFERDAEVGDVRVLRKDYSPLWFIAANHIMTFELARAAVLRLLRLRSDPTHPDGHR